MLIANSGEPEVVEITGAEGAVLGTITITRRSPSAGTLDALEESFDRVTGSLNRHNSEEQTPADARYRLTPDVTLRSSRFPFLISPGFDKTELLSTLPWD